MIGDFVVSYSSPSAILVTDVDGFVGVRLKFRFDAEHPTQQTKGRPVLLRDWVKQFAGAKWDSKTKTWYVPDVTDIPRGDLSAAGFTTYHPDGRRARPSDLNSDRPPATPVAIPKRADCRLPGWFGLPLYPYQLAGAIDIVQGKRILADAPGVGKTRTSLAAAAMLDVTRILILCPPVVVTHWKREIEESQLAAHITAPGGTTIDHTPPEHGGPPSAVSIVPHLNDNDPTSICVIKTGAKQPKIPTTGIVLASSALVASRPALARTLAEWRPEVFIYDEAHGAKTWGSRRSRVFRRLAESCSLTIPTTGTPMMASPLELAPLLDMVWALNSLFGGYYGFRETYTRPTTWGWKPKKNMLSGLREVLDRDIWVRRTKNDVLAEMPPKARNAIWVDVSLKDYQAALKDVNDIIDEWIIDYRIETGCWPDDNAVQEWCSEQLAMVSRLRQAAGLSKVQAAVDFVDEWLQANPTDPIVLWAHHKAVVAALYDGLESNLPSGAHIGVIDGSRSEADRSDTVDAFQRGEIRVLLCSIQAAGVGITLTRSSEAVFVETDWTPALMTQAEDRQHRVGQDRPVTYTTLVAAGTLDERVQAVLGEKAGTLDAVMDGDHRVGVSVSGQILASDILRDLVEERILAAKRQAKRSKAA
ncbi:MAG: DEAD/DEAH box helicase [Acidimicrobiales bacterium]